MSVFTEGYGESLWTSTLKTEGNKSTYSKAKENNEVIENVVHINHPYLKEELCVNNLDDYKNEVVKYREDIKIITNKDYLPEEQRKWAYTGDEESIFCGRFPHIKYCGCKFPCSLLLEKISPIEVIDHIFCGPIECAYKTKELLEMKIGYILNLSCISYTKRNRFKYLDIFINDNHTENAIKFFKITNRFIAEALENNVNILIHSEQGRCRCWVFLMGYLIGRMGLKFTQAYDLVKEKCSFADPNDNFLTQLKHYDLDVNI